MFATIVIETPTGSTSTKPRFIDFDSAVSVAGLAEEIRHSDCSVTFTEALPGPDESHPGPEGRSRAIEAVVTTSRYSRK